ncbi:ATP-binding cassette domain-containing protein [Rhodocytophaga aerolata]|uniref:ATP-binding cassette domain-containing protein n=1 Tax=Rhodocytophaga aerolata TaxID=455078 RepID=A0ABT8R1V6_9BACT|nr:ATP-binding cassette domain-containing protein [Rhodocytophaga aerolata]MDO1446070.1 ATP-binding cassette domain-containing protein [Rhodocytophaga aerolata]
MSEEILKALTQLFAIITKQDGGVTEVERKYVIQFFRQELDQDSVKEYVELYDQFAGYGNEDKGEAKLTSVKDSVKTLAICKKINKTLTQKQKVVVLIRLLELVSSDKNFTPQRMSIIDTVSTVFNIAKEDFQIIEKFVLHENTNTLTDFEDILLADSKSAVHPGQAKHLLLDHLHGQIVFLRVKSVDLYFVRYNGDEELQLNGLLLKPYQVYLFSNGSTIKTPKSSPIYYSDVVSFFLSNLKTKNLSFTVKSLEFKFPNGAIGLRDVHISEGPGKLIGIMGGSGAGKTTLLNVLAGIENPSKGEILINGINVHTQKDEVQGVFGYVAQDDLLIEELSVYENLYYNAKLCFAHLTEEELHKAVINVLASLGLEHIKDLKVGNVLNKKISGGQRKRLNIALELIREPAVMFVDEPTSGLSSRDSENVIDLLKELSLKGKLIFVVIHQPSSDIFKMFDKLFLLDTGGYPIYYGNPVESVIYFKKATNQVDSDKGQCHTCGNVNPEQIFNIIEAKVVDEYGQFTNKRKVTPPQWNERYLQNFKLEEVTLVKENPPKALNLPSRFKQTVIFTVRDFLSKISNVQYMLINLLQAPVLAAILALVIRYKNDPDSSGYIYRYNDNIPAYILVAILVALFMGLTVSAEEIIRDKKIQKRESFLNLSRTSYLSSKLIILFVLSAIQTLSFVLIGNWILEVKGMTLSYWMVLFTMSCFANILGLNISASFNSVVTVYITIPLILIPQIVLSGVMFSFDKLNDMISTKGKVPIIADFIASRWGFEALAIEQYKNNPYQVSYYDLEKIQSKAYFKYTYLIPELSERLERSKFHAKDKTDSIQTILAKDLKVIREEINAEVNKRGLSIDVNSALTTHGFDERAADKVSFYLETLKQSYIKQFNDADYKKERLIEHKSANPEYNLTAYKNLYYNESLADFMKNTSTKNRIIEYEGKLIQQIDPVYTDPTNIAGKLDYRAHFLAPTKHMGGMYMSTFAFNLMVVWILTGLLYVTLYFEAFKGALSILGRIKFDFATTYLTQVKNKIMSTWQEIKIKKSRVATN